MIALTNDADKMICCLYKEYLVRRKHGISKPNARRFQDECFSSDNILSKWLPADISDTKLELAQKKYLKVYIGGDFEFQDEAVIYMENRFKSGLIEITDFITKFIP